MAFPRKRHDSNNSYKSSLIPNAVLFNKKAPTNRASNCPFSKADAPEIDYKNIVLLSQYVSEKGRMVPSRINNVSAKMQRKLKKAINIARALALLPYSANYKG